MERPYTWTAVYLWARLFAFNLIQLSIFRRFDFVSMYSFRLLYYRVLAYCMGLRSLAPTLLADRLRPPDNDGGNALMPVPDLDQWLLDAVGPAIRPQHRAFRFPAAYLQEGSSGYWILGSQMRARGAGGNMARELESTFWMRKPASLRRI